MSGTQVLSFFRYNEVAMSEMEQNDAADTSHQYSDLDGAVLEWGEYGCTHARLRLLASGLSRGFAELHFSFTKYVDCPTKMHDIKFRHATEDETERVRESIPADKADLLEPEELYIIECREGIYSVWGDCWGFVWVEKPNEEYLDELLSRPLWKDGPPLSEL